MTDDDPADSPIVRHVLYTNEVGGLLSAVVSGLLFRARPERVKAALEELVENFDAHVKRTRQMAEAYAAEKGEPSGWEDPPEETLQ